MNCIGMCIAEGQPNKWAMAQIWNPPTSGVTLQVSSVRIAFSVSSGSPKVAADLVHSTVAIGAIAENRPFGKDFVSVPKAEFHTVQVDPSSQTGIKPFYEIWVGDVSVDKPYLFNPPLLLAPGHGIHVRGALAGVYTIVSWEWCEV